MINDSLMPVQMRTRPDILKTVLSTNPYLHPIDGSFVEYISNIWYNSDILVYSICFVFQLIVYIFKWQL